MLPRNINYFVVQTLVLSCILVASEISGQDCPIPDFGPPLGREIQVTSEYDPERTINNKPRPHYGVDLRSNGDEVLAAGDGEIEYAGKGSTDPSLWLVVIRHTNGVKSRYLHLEANSTDHLVKGSIVQRGDLIGISDNSGCCNTGPHLHYDVATPNGKINPLPCLMQDESLLLSGFSVVPIFGTVEGGAPIQITASVHAEGSPDYTSSRIEIYEDGNLFHTFYLEEGVDMYRASIFTEGLHFIAPNRRDAAILYEARLFQPNKPAEPPLTQTWGPAPYSWEFAFGGVLGSGALWTVESSVVAEGDRAEVKGQFFISKNFGPYSQFESTEALVNADFSQQYTQFPDPDCVETGNLTLTEPCIRLLLATDLSSLGEFYIEYAACDHPSVDFSPYFDQSPDYCGFIDPTSPYPIHVINLATEGTWIYPEYGYDLDVSSTLTFSFDGRHDNPIFFTTAEDKYSDGSLRSKTTGMFKREPIIAGSEVILSQGSESGTVSKSRYNDSQRVTVGSYPNPFNPATTISFDLPITSHVVLEIYNLLGQRIEILADRTFDAGNHSIEWDATNYSSGVYFYRLTTENGTLSKKMLLLK